MSRLKLMAAAASAIAVMTGAPTASIPSFWRAGTEISRGHNGRRGRNGQTKRNRFPKAFRQYAKRYGSNDHDMARLHQLLRDVEMLDHERDRARRRYHTAMAEGSDA